MKYRFLVIMTTLARTTAFCGTRFRLIHSHARKSVVNSNSNTNVVENEFSAKPITWYPGHIAKAERELAEYLKKVDVVIEVRDARIPLATTHPLVPTWVGNKPLIVAIARIDQISKQALSEWRKYYANHAAHAERPDAKVFFIDGVLGNGVPTLKKHALLAGKSINERRKRRGLQPRPVRAAVIGYPNVGKSALINRLLGKRMAQSKNLPGVTRSLQWIRLGGDDMEEDSNNAIELLDSPGIIPAKQINQQNACKLAICNDIGAASYDRIVMAGKMCDLINELHKTHPSFCDMETLLKRYRDIPFQELSGEDIVEEVAQKLCTDSASSAADKLLGDFRKCLYTYASLEAPPTDEPAEKKKYAANISSVQKKAVQPAGSLDVKKGFYDGW